MKLSKFEQIGITKEKIPVYSGTYYFLETHGIPLDLVISMHYEKNIIPSWIHLYVDMLISGIKPNIAISKIEAAITEGHSQKLANEVIFKLKQFKVEKI